MDSNGITRGHRLKCDLYEDAKNISQTEIEEAIQELLPNKMNKAFKVANNAIYFNDSSDYLTALCEICEILRPSDYKHEDGEEYIEE